MHRSQTADQEMVRKVNRSLVLNTLRLYAPISRVEVANLTGLNRSTVSNIINALIDEGMVWEQERQDSRVGRPSVSLTLRPDGGAVIGVEIGVDFISVLMTDFVAKPLYQDWIDLPEASPQIDVLVQAEQSIDQAIALANQQRLKLLGIGVGVPGLVNTNRGELIFAPNLKWRDVPLRLMWNQRFHLPIYVENEANLAALGEYYFGVARGVDDFVYLSSGIGLGGGMIVNGKLYGGAHGFAGEIGHMQRDPNGEQCACGRRGCWETQVGPRAVLRRVKNTLRESPDSPRPVGCAADLSNLTFTMVSHAALNGDPICRQAIEGVAEHLGRGIADLVNLFNPDLVVIGGALSLGKEILLPVIEKTVFDQSLGPSSNSTRIAFSERGKDACVYGAVAVVLDDILREMVLV
ncbi:MAG: ROK family transcriptional regulator [Chloroflexi bacterium]|nr:ROK family transcriptional regulator [Anaerolineaceae bacterium]NMB87578.1 ROK family transcriptional regulator [Chloroflexota bacterium]